jgi:hypothetical protein
MDKIYSVIKDSHDVMKELLTDNFGYHRRLKSFIKGAFYGQILIHQKVCINEVNVELDVNSLYESSMATRKIPKGKQKFLTDRGK